jgi:hypothetical protein
MMAVLVALPGHGDSREQLVETWVWTRAVCTGTIQNSVFPEPSYCYSGVVELFGHETVAY